MECHPYILYGIAVWFLCGLFVMSRMYWTKSDRSEMGIAWDANHKEFIFIHVLLLFSGPIVPTFMWHEFWDEFFDD